MSQKRISRARKRDLEQPDEFISVTAAALQKINQYRAPLAIGIVVVVTSLAAFSAIRFFGNRAENNAFQRLSANLKAYQAVAREDTPQEALAKIKPQFESFLAEDGQREGGKLARLIYADLHYRVGQYDTAIASYEEALETLPKTHFAYGTALSGLGYAYLGAGKNDQAAECFKKVVDANHPGLKADALFQLGRLYGQQGQTAKQKKTYQRLLDEAPAYIYADLIRPQIES